MVTGASGRACHSGCADSPKKTADELSMTIPLPMTSPRVLMISGNAPPMMDGVGDCTDRLLEALVRKRPDWRWFWLSRRPRWFHSPIVFRAGVALIRPSHAWTARGTALVRAAVKALRPDLVHIQEQIHSFHETGAACRIAEDVRGAGRPLVTTLHEYHVELPSVRHTTGLVKLSTAVIANDPRNAERCRSEAGRAVDACWWSGGTVLPPAPGARPPTVPGRLSTFGFLTSLKSLEVVSEAIRRLRPTHPDLDWRIIGPFDPESNPHHTELAGRVGAEGTFTGGFSVRDPRLRALLAESQIMLLPFADGASERRTSLHAAWAHGLPVITTPPPTERTSIVDGENCLLVRAPTAAAWAEAIGRVLSDDGLAQRLRAGSLTMAERFSWDRLAERHIELYENLLRAQDGARGARRAPSFSV